MDENLSSQLKHLPTSAGVYVYRDADGQPLYVGKAKNLRRRVRQYFTGRQNGRTALLVSHIVSVEIIVAESEREALLMESNLIKTYRPRYNVELKDDKSYPYFRITVQEEYPRLEITRHPDRGESLYFGPFTDVGSARETMNYLHRAFPLRRCKGPEPGGRSRSGRPCLDFQMGRCTGPCEEEIDSEDYRKIVDGLIDFLKGKGMKVARSLEREMNQLSSQQKYEEAALLRDRIQAIYSVLEGQHAVGDPGDDLDVLGYGASNGITVMVCLFIRSGLIVGRREMVMSGQFGAEESFEAFISSHYRKHVHIPPRILFPIGLEFAIEHEEVLSRIAGRKVRIQKPFRGKGAGLIQLANENARQALKSNEAIRSEAADITSEIAHSLDLPVPPRRIECVDISHTSGQLAYGSLVAWENGDLVKRDYRLFSIKGSLTPGDDYAALEEVLTRRFTGSASEQLKIPDLLLVDGGKGQLSRVERILEDLPVWDLSLAAISKAKAARKREGSTAVDEIYIPGRSNPKRLAQHSKALHLLQMLRDEAHRFAVSGHRKKRTKVDLLSTLDGIDGVGPKRRTALMNHFRSIEEIKAAPIDDLASLKGFNRKIAARIKEVL
jgi:excinuclease ABC subunit C